MNIGNAEVKFVKIQKDSSPRKSYMHDDVPPHQTYKRVPFLTWRSSGVSCYVMKDEIGTIGFFCVQAVLW